MVLWMESYLFYCSVRLGVIVVSVLTFLQVFIPAILLLALGLDLLKPIIKLVENDDHYKKIYVVIKFTDWIENNPSTFNIVLNFFLFLHMSCCLMAIFGALRLHKWFLMPFIVFEFMRFILCLACHILLMIILKKRLNLGFLIAVTLAGGFLILYLGYNWAASVALFQIIDLIHSNRYRQLYGDDPFKPRLLATPINNTHYGYGTIENVRVLVTPNANEIDELKQKQQATKATQPVIAVLPANYENNERVNIVSNRSNRWQGQKNQQPQLTLEQQQNAYNADYANWQWSELAGGRARQRNMLIGPNW